MKLPTDHHFFLFRAEDILELSSLSGFPLVNNKRDMFVRGFVVRREIEAALGECFEVGTRGVFLVLRGG